MRYDLKDEELLQITDFCCEDCLTEDIVEAIFHLRKYESIDVYAKAPLIGELVSRLHGSCVDGNEITLGLINFDGSECDYVGEYVMSISDGYELWIEPAYRLKDGEWKLYDSEAILAYVYEEDCKQDLIDKLEKCDVPTLLFGFEKE